MLRFRSKSSLISCHRPSIQSCSALLSKSLQTSTLAKWTASRVRQEFLDFWTKDTARGPHLHVPASRLVPQNDRTIEFTNAGMNQFKSILLGDDDRSPKRIANWQRCLRIGGKHNDLDLIGKSFRHHTFFEMLGNWSFNGSYGRTEACRWALQFLEDSLSLDRRNLFVTYFGGDDSLGLPEDEECKNIWLQLG